MTEALYTAEAHVAGGRSEGSTSGAAVAASTAAPPPISSASPARHSAPRNAARCRQSGTSAC